MIYEVPSLQLIPQDRSMACWYASAQMVIQWRRTRTLLCEIKHPDPSEVPSYMQMHVNNDGIPWASIRKFARDLGLVPLPLMSPTSEALLGWLRLYGPIWADGMKFITHAGREQAYGHVVVIGGISTSPDRILIFDPEHGGSRRWMPMTHLARILSDGANLNRNAFFLRLS
jgi:hypothetical protein